MLSEAMHKSIDFSLQKMKKLVAEAEKKGYKRWWENNQIWEYYFHIVGHILAGKKQIKADELLSRSKKIRAETLDEFTRKQKGEKTWITEIMENENAQINQKTK